jgi:septal ring factor EnvC (AmiA/AmiB activator)
MTTDQYKQSGPAVIKANVKSAEVKRQESVEASIKELNERITTQYKLIDKLVRDMKRIKDQISELAGRIPRG